VKNLNLKGFIKAKFVEDSNLFEGSRILEFTAI